MMFLLTLFQLSNSLLAHNSRKIEDWRVPLFWTSVGDQSLLKPLPRLLNDLIVKNTSPEYTSKFFKLNCSCRVIYDVSKAFYCFSDLVFPVYFSVIYNILCFIHYRFPNILVCGLNIF